MDQRAQSMAAIGAALGAACLSRAWLFRGSTGRNDNLDDPPSRGVVHRSTTDPRRNGDAGKMPSPSEMPVEDAEKRWGWLRNAPKAAPRPPYFPATA